jgi:proteasome lid subunit RPN8/RPN11
MTTDRQLVVSADVWSSTWLGLRERGQGQRETASVWLGKKTGTIEHAHVAVFLDDLPGTVGRRLQHRTSRTAIDMLLARARELGMVIVADIHTHPADWVDLSDTDRLHPIEYRIGLLALVLPDFAASRPDLQRVGVHEYVGDGEWTTFRAQEAARRMRIVGAEEAP